MTRFTTLSLLVLAAALSVGPVACGGESDEAGGGGATTANTTEAAPPTTAADSALTDGEGEFGTPERVRATANLFAAGLQELPQPAGGGGGGFPPVWDLSPGQDRIVIFPSVTGEVNPIVNIYDYNGPEGDGRGPTDVNSYGGISGVVHRRNAMFLAGVFLTDEAPSEPSPPRLDFTQNEDFDVLAPKIGQTFFVGDGQGRRYRVPADATRLFLGFVDARFFVGDPGFYNNNAGELVVTVELTAE